MENVHIILKDIKTKKHNFTRIVKLLSEYKY